MLRLHEPAGRPAENGLARIACKILCCSFSSIGRSSSSSFHRTGPEQSEGKHTTTDTAIAGAFLLLEIYTEQTLQRHGPENARKRVINQWSEVWKIRRTARPSINHADLRAQFSE